MPKLTEDAKRNIIWWQNAARQSYKHAQISLRLIDEGFALRQWRYWTDAQARQHRRAAEAMRQTDFDIDDDTSHEWPAREEWPYSDRGREEWRHEAAAAQALKR